MNTEELRGGIDEEISSVCSKYRYSPKSTEKILSLFNRWLEERGAYHYTWKDGEQHFSNTKSLTPLRLK